MNDTWVIAISSDRPNEPRSVGRAVHQTSPITSDPVHHVLTTCSDTLGERPNGSPVSYTSLPEFSKDSPRTRQS